MNMLRKTVFTLITLFTLTLTVSAKSKGYSQSLLKVCSYDRQGKELHRGWGFFVSAGGTAVAPYEVFKEAWSAKITDSKGKQWNVTRICGASDLYDVVKFNTDCNKATPLEPSAQKPARGAAVVLQTLKSTLPATVTESSTYEGVTYYTLSLKSDDNAIGLPLTDSEGKVACIMQKTADKDKSKSYAVDFSVVGQLQISAISAGQTALNAIHMAKQLPDDAQQASSYLYLLARNTEDTLSYLTGLGDYISKFPEQATGYVDRATFYAYNGRYAEAETDFNEALRKVKNQDEVHFGMSKLLYQLNLYKSYRPYKDWTLERALSEAQQAQQLSPNTIYLLQIGDCQFAMKQYADAFNTYQEINKTPGASAQTFFYAARARECLDNDSATVLALLDSAMARFTQPYRSPAGPYLLQRAQHRDKYGFYHNAAIDYHDYEQLIGTEHLNDEFFYQKEQCDLKAHLYQWALEDIDKALTIKPKEYLYRVEKVAILLRVGSYDEAIYEAREALKLNPEGSDAYKFIGIAYGQKGNDAEALKNLNKAKELGDTQVDEWIKNLQKARK